MRLHLLTVVFTLLLLSCVSERGKNHDKSLMLTANAWNLQQEGDLPMVGLWSFKMNGTYVDNAYSKKGNPLGYVIGEWRWRNEEEIMLSHAQILKHGKVHDISENNFYIFRITKLTDENLEGTIRNSADSSKGLFAKHMVFVVEKSAAVLDLK